MRPIADNRLVQARAELEGRGVVAADLLPERIAQSWRRCLDAGLDPLRPPVMEVVDEAVLRQARQRRDLLWRLAVGEMENLYHQIAGTNFMIAFATADGMLLDAITDPTFDEAARATAIRPGSLWTEPRCGTNALGGVIATSRPFTVHGAEHFFTRHGDLTCVAAPVFAADGTLAGVLDASSDCRSRQEHTRALVAMSAAQIENVLFREHHRTDIVIAFHSRPEYLHTLSVGLLAVDPGGVLLGSNGRARALLQGLPVHRGHRMQELFATDFVSLQLAARQSERCELRDRVGSVFAARIENLRPLSQVAVPAQPVAALGRTAGRAAPAHLVAQDPMVAEALREVEAAAVRKLPVLITGETGTGKEQVARHAHEASGRQGAFVPVNCAALPETLAEAELFGHAEGAFTGARRGGAPGLVREADGGTLFLDEIGDMKPGLQSMLLRLLDDWMVRPVGGGRPRVVDVLLLSATNVTLREAVARGSFRRDLYYRLATIEVLLPPLRERSDFAAIVRHTLTSVAPGWRVDDGAMELMARWEWPGNIRELRAVLSRLAIGGAQGTIDETMVRRLPVFGAVARPDGGNSLRDTMRDRIRDAVRDCGGNISEAARRLGVSRNTVYRAMLGPDHAAGKVG